MNQLQENIKIVLNLIDRKGINNMIYGYEFDAIDMLKQYIEEEVDND